MKSRSCLDLLQSGSIRTMNIEELTDNAAVMVHQCFQFPTTMTKRYIGRTSAYYGDDDDYVFTPDLWTDSYNPDDLAGEVHELTEDGEKILDDYYLDLGAGYDLCNGKAQGLANRFSREQMWEHLTDPANEYSVKL